MTTLAWLALTTLGVLIQAVAWPLLWPGALRPEVVLVLAILAGLRAGLPQALLWGALGGFLLDLLSVREAGFHAATVLVAAALGVLSAPADWPTPLRLGTSVGVATLSALGAQALLLAEPPVTRLLAPAGYLLALNLATAVPLALLPLGRPSTPRARRRSL